MNDDLQAAIDYIYTLVNYELTKPETIPPDAWNLQTPRALLEFLGNPHLAYPTIHVAGTKGKGSTAAFIAQVLQESGLRTGLYTSPHLVDFRERIQINRELISPEAFVALVNDLKPYVPQVPGLTWFEALTSLAFWHFAREQCDVGVIEVGMGGRLDATNVIRPVVSAIANLSFDHTQLLGNTLAEIAAEKAAIIKAGIPAVSAPQRPEAEEVLTRTAVEQGSRLIFVGREWQYAVESLSLTGTRITVTHQGERRTYDLAMLGAVQAENATLALAALAEAEKAGIPITGDARREGLANMKWPGRLQVVRQEPLVILDSAHNRHSARRLVEDLHALVGSRPLTFALGFMADKDIDGMLTTLLPAANRVILTRADHPRAVEVEKLRERVAAIGARTPTASFAAVSEAVIYALAEASPDDVICIMGSLAVVGEALRLLENV